MFQDKNYSVEDFLAQNIDTITMCVKVHIMITAIYELFACPLEPVNFLKNQSKQAFHLDFCAFSFCVQNGMKWQEKC